jgi:uncharacterized membrane protein
MTEPVHTTVLQTLHVGGGWLAFALAPVALLARKGSRRHIFAGRGFVLALTAGITAGLLLAMIDRVVGLFFFGLLTLFLLGTGYLAPHIARGSRRGYRLDRALTGLGAIGSLGLIGDGLIGTTSPYEGLSFGGLGLAIVVAHARWRGPKDPSRWRAEHLTSLLAAYTVGWTFILGLYVPRLTAQSRLAVPILGLVGILWARRRFGRPAIATKAATARTGAA